MKQEGKAREARDARQVHKHENGTFRKWGIIATAVAIIAVIVVAVGLPDISRRNRCINIRSELIVVAEDVIVMKHVIAVTTQCRLG